MEDDEAAIEEFPDLDGEAGVGSGGGHLRPAGSEVHGVVAGDDAAIAAAEDQRQVGRGPAP
ncbi:MAG: L,D-transpeptidase, partial [Candidatus Rokuibacteriota bacterium]